MKFTLNRKCLMKFGRRSLILFLSVLPDAISSDVESVYKYLENIKLNIADTDIDKVKIKFKVDKS